MTARQLALLALAFFLPLASPVHAAPPPTPAYHADYEHRISYAGLSPDHQALLHRIRADIYRIALPPASPTPLTVRDAIEVVRQGFRARHPENQGISIFLKLPAGQSPESLPRVVLPARPYTVAEGFDRVCAAAACLWTVDSFAIAIVPLYDPPPQSRPATMQPNPALERTPTGGDAGPALHVRPRQ